MEVEGDSQQDSGDKRSNKEALREYVSLFPEGNEIVEEHRRKLRSTKSSSIKVFYYSLLISRSMTVL